jgi:hypothetical protein
MEATMKTTSGNDCARRGALLLQGLCREHEWFEAQLSALLPEHRGQFALVFGRVVRGFFQTLGDAHKAGWGRFGLDATFLVAEVAEPQVQVCFSPLWVDAPMCRACGGITVAAASGRTCPSCGATG